MSIMCVPETVRKRIYRPLIPMTICFIFGIVIGAWWPGYFGWVLSTALILFLVVFIQYLRKLWAFVIPMVLCVLCGYLSIQSWLDADLPDHHVVHFVDDGSWNILGVVTKPARIQHYRWQFELAVRKLENQRNSHGVTGLVKVTGRGPWPGANIGDTVLFRGRLRSIRSFSNPGGFDYKRFLLLNDIRAQVYVSANSLEVLSRASSNEIFLKIQKLRNLLSFQMEHVLQTYSSDTISLLKTLILGDRNAISSSLRADFNRAGAGHVLAISGLHIGMVATVSFIIVRWIVALIPFFIRRAWVHKAAALISFLSVLAYGLLAGLSPSTQRAMLMVTVFLFGFWVGRRHDWLNTLALAALVILVIFPPALLSISFQLSFTAVLAIITGTNFMPPAETVLAFNLWKKMIYRLGGFVWVSVAAVLGTLPLVLFYFNQISLIGPMINLTVVPLIGFIVVPAGLVAAFSDLTGILFGDVFWHVAAYCGQWVLRMVQYAASLPWAAVQCVTPSVLEIGLYFLFVALGVFWRRLPYRRTILTVLLILGVMDVGFWVYQRYGRHDLRVTILDVGQASANLLELPGGYTIIVDGGGFSDNSIFDVGAAVIAPVLWRKKIKTIDLMVLSHANSDHLNGLLYILEHFNVREVWSNQEGGNTKGYTQWSALLRRCNILHPNFHQMPRQIIRNNVQLEILAPPKNYSHPQNHTPWRNLNNNSLVLRVCYNDISFLFPGDIMKHAEADLLARNGSADLQSTVLLVPHHGSNGSCSNEFVKVVSPIESVISAGWQNRFNFPHEDVLKRLKATGSRIWCTADSGAVEITTNGNRYKVETYRP